MTHVLKKGKNKSMARRPISLTHCVCKTIQHIFNQRLRESAESEIIVCSEQAGFREAHQLRRTEIVHLV